MPPVTAPATEPTDDDAFSAAFASLTAPEPVESGVPPVGDPATAVVDPVTEPAADPVAVADPEPVAVADPKPVVQPDPAAAAKPPVPEPVQAVDPSANDDMLQRLAALVKDPPAAPVKSAAPAPVELFTAEEKTLLATYDKDWPDISRAENIRRRADAHELARHVFSEVFEFVQPLMATVQKMAAEGHLADIEAAEPDYNDLRDKVVAWVGKETRPAHRAVYDNIVKQGTPAEIADLVQMYKQATGVTAPVVVAAPAAELPPAVKKAAAAMAPVKSVRSTPAPAGTDPNDFSGTFKQLIEADRAATAAAAVARR